MYEQLTARVKQMFPNANLDEAIKTATQAVQGKSPNDAPSIFKSLGITESNINQIYNKYGNTVQAKMLLSMVNQTPDSIKDTALGFLGGNSNNVSVPISNKATSKTTKNYPRLK